MQDPTIIHRNLTLCRISDPATFKALCQDAGMADVLVHTWSGGWVAVKRSDEGRLMRWLDRAGERPRLEGRWKR